MKGSNLCAWLKRGEVTTCGKSRCGIYCKVHLARIRRGNRIPRSCRLCEKGVQRERQLCRGCGRDKIRSRHIVLEQKVKKLYNSVLAQLLAARIPIWRYIMYTIYRYSAMDATIEQLLAEIAAVRSPMGE